jgi:hypothetical protein
MTHSVENGQYRRCLTFRETRTEKSCRKRAMFFRLETECRPQSVPQSVRIGAWRSAAGLRIRGHRDHRRHRARSLGPRCSVPRNTSRYPYGQKIHLGRFRGQPRIVSGGEYWPGQRGLSQYFKYMARARISEFESSHPSHAVSGSARAEFRFTDDQVLLAQAGSRERSAHQQSGNADEVRHDRPLSAEPV